MKIQRVHILSSILAFVFSGAVIFFSSQNQSYLDQTTYKLPEVFEQTTAGVELEFRAEPIQIKQGEKSKIKLILKNKGTATIKDIIYKVSVPNQFAVVKDSIPANGLINKDFGIFLSGVQVNDNDIVFYMVNYPALDTNTFLINGLELISFDVIVKDNATIGSYNIGFKDDFNNQFLNLNKQNVLDKVTNATLVVIDKVTLINSPTLLVYTPTTYNLNYKFQGTKQAGTGIKINDQEAFSESDALTWEANMPLTKLGKNQFEFKAFKSNNESAVVKAEIFKQGLADLIVGYNSNQESKVDIDDLALFIKAYRDFRDIKNRLISPSDETSYRLSDMNIVSGVIGDGIIDVDDLAEFIKNWRKVYTYVK